MAIINGKFPPLPLNSNLSCFYDIIKGCLQVPTSQRLTTAMILERLAAIAESNNFDPREPAKVDIQKPALPPRPAPPVPSASMNSAPLRPAPPIPLQRPNTVPVTTQKLAGSQQSSGLKNSFINI